MPGGRWENLAPSRHRRQTAVVCSSALLDGRGEEGEGGAADGVDGEAERRTRLVYREGGHDDLEGLTDLSMEAFHGGSPVSTS